MAYRGEDLDLRTPQNWAPPPDFSGAGDISAAQPGKRTLHAGPILVDDTVLACCNNAYDLAVAHRASEVRIEHLLNAMARIDAAVAVLEARGIRVASLRRETAAILASEIPAVAGNGVASPRRSDELLDVLRGAANLAGRRNAAASIDDLLQVLLDHRAEMPASELLLRFASRMAVRELPEPLPPLTRAVQGGARYGDYPRGYRGDFAGSPADAIQNSRIEALEQMVRALSQDFSSERHVISGLVRDLSRDTQAHQDDQGRRQTMLLDRIGTLEDAMDSHGAGGNEALVSKLEGIEAALELRLQEMSQSWSVLSQRLQDLEVLIRERPEAGASPAEAMDLKPLVDRLAIIEEALLTSDGKGHGELGERFETLLSGVDRVTGLSDRVDAQHVSVNQAFADLAARLSAVEQSIAAEIETAAAKHQAYTKDLTEVHDALMKVNQNQHTLAGSLDQWRTDTAGDVANILNRLNALDRDNALPVTTLNALKAHMDTMNRLIIERYHRRHRFRFWLFGTDDWLGASWPSQKEAVEAEQQRIKEAGEAAT